MAKKTNQAARNTAALALACGASNEVAAGKAKVNEKTVRRWLKDPGFRREVQELRCEILWRAIGQLTALCTESVRTFLRLQQPDKAGKAGAVQLGAARASFDVLIRLRDSVDLEMRLAALEVAEAERKAQEARGHGRWQAG